MKTTKRFYVTSNGKIPFDEWLESLDFQDSHLILVKISRLMLGNTSNCEPVGNSVHELKIYFGPGYRVYFVNLTQDDLLILSGGSKKRQQKDIDKAISYYNDYKMRYRYENK